MRIAIVIDAHWHHVEYLGLCGKCDEFDAGRNVDWFYDDFACFADKRLDVECDFDTVRYYARIAWCDKADACGCRSVEIGQSDGFGRDRVEF